MIYRFFLSLMLLVSSSVWATVDQYAFTSAAQQAQFMALIEELRCPKCQNQTLADSNAQIAKDMRDEVFRLMQQGHTDQQITAYLVSRYGDFVRYKPPLNTHTSWLWGLPVLLFVFAVMIVVLIARKQGQLQSQANTALTAEQQAALEQIKRGES